MTHDEMKNKLEAYFDGELPAAENQEIAAHAENCVDCRKVLVTWDAVRRAFSKAKNLPPSENFVQSVIGRIEELEKPAPEPVKHEWPVLRWFVPALGYSFAFLLMFAAIVSRQTPTNAEAILMADMPEYSQWAVEEDDPGMDSLFVMEQGGN